MFEKSQNPFAVAGQAKNGASPSPFQQAAPVNGGNHSPRGDFSPFEAAPTTMPKTGLPERRMPVSDESQAPQFAMAERSAAAGAGASPFAVAPAIVEPTEGFGAERPQAVGNAPVPMPTHYEQGRGNDPFASPIPLGVNQGVPQRGDFMVPTEGGASPAFHPSVAGPAPGRVTPEAASPAVVEAVTSETSQLVLRAIFGVTKELDRSEILERARTLPGIRNVQVIGQSEVEAMNTLRNSVHRLGFGDQRSLVLMSNGGAIDFIQEPGMSLAVLREGNYAAGVRETLIIVARELAHMR